MTRSQKTKLARLMERLAHKTQFMVEIKRARTMLDIPTENGFDSDTEYMDWFMKHRSQYRSFESFYEVLDELSLRATNVGIELLKKNKIAVDSKILAKYIPSAILFGFERVNFENEDEAVFGYCGISLFRLSNVRGLVNYMSKVEPAGAVLVLTPEVTKNELRDFIENEFSSLRILLGNKNKPFKIRERTKAKEHDKIYRFACIYLNKSAKELRRIANAEDYDRNDKSTLIARILGQKHGIQIKPENLRTIISRMKKDREIT